MKARTRRRIETGARVLGFALAHPDACAGSATTLAELGEQVARAKQLITLQRDGFNQARSAAVQKQDLRRIIRRTQLLHLARVAQRAAHEAPFLAQKFVLRPEQIPYLEFQSWAHAMLAESQNHKELLVQYGLSDTLLEGLVENLDRFDQAMEQGIEARRTHVRASAELDVIGREILRLVKVMDALNRYRFEGAREVLAEWESVSYVLDPKTGGETDRQTDDQPGDPDIGGGAPDHAA
jgi:hypothetical protein